MTERGNRLLLISAIGAFLAAAVFLIVMAAMVLLGRPERVQFELGVPFSLIDQTGATITQAAFQGQPTLLFFGFTNCPEFCPLTVYEMTTWFEALGAEADEIDAYFITVDPERDTPEVLNDYLTAQSDRVIGITGPMDEMRALWKGWRVFVKKGPEEDGGYNVNHWTGIFMLDDRGRVFGTIPYGSGSERALASLRELLDS